MKWNDAEVEKPKNGKRVLVVFWICPVTVKYNPVISEMRKIK